MCIIFFEEMHVYLDITYLVHISEYEYIPCSYCHSLHVLNQLFGKDHTKNYYSHDGICASVIRTLTLHGSLNDSITNDMIYVISTS